MDREEVEMRKMKIRFCVGVNAKGSWSVVGGDDFPAKEAAQQAFEMAYSYPCYPGCVAPDESFEREVSVQWLEVEVDVPDVDGQAEEIRSACVEAEANYRATFGPLEVVK